MADEVGALAAVEIDPSLGVLRFFAPLETTWVKATVGESHHAEEDPGRAVAVVVISENGIHC
jgi:hypothetical protein